MDAKPSVSTGTKKKGPTHMQCIRPIKASFDRAGELTFSHKKADPAIVGFAFPCRKCLPCRLNIAREKAVRAWHESQTCGDSIFLTLTYNDANLKSPKLQYLDFQLFMKSLRELRTRNITDPDLKKQLAINYIVTGEYGDKKKRPHWHALIFNYKPADARHFRTTERGDREYKSEEINQLWKRGDTLFGDITIDSANYVARYAAKKLVHGQDQEHDFHPIHKTSSKHAIGKRWIEKYYEQTFSHGYVHLPNFQRTKIPRYYEDWLKKNHPDRWTKYVTQVKLEIRQQAEMRARKEEIEYISECFSNSHCLPLKKTTIQLKILEQKFKRLQENLKL